jgi:hypothetical protein
MPTTKKPDTPKKIIDPKKRAEQEAEFIRLCKQLNKSSKERLLEYMTALAAEK